MKLYTEEQVRKAIDYGAVDLLNSLSHRKDMFVNSLTPIELPTWEDVRKAITMARGIKYVTYSEEEIIEQLKQSK